MTYNAIKNYLSNKSIGYKELELVKDLIKENNNSLNDYLPDEENIKNYVLSSLLSESLKDYEKNKDMVQDILTYQTPDNKSLFYNILKDNKFGMQLIKENVHLQESKDKTFEDVLLNEGNKNLLAYVKENLSELNVDVVYKINRKTNLKLNTIQTLEKAGMVFDKRIVNCLANESNYKNPKELLKYVNKFKEETENKTWDKLIIEMMSYLDRQIWDWNGRYKYGDTFALVTEMKSLKSYKWGQEIEKNRGFGTRFAFNHAVEAFYKQPYTKSIYDDLSAKRKEVKELFKNSNFKLEYFHKFFIGQFIDVLTSEAVEIAIDKSWTNMLRFDNRRDREFFSLHNNEPIFDLSKIEEDNLFKNKKVLPYILKKYLHSENKMKLSRWDEEKLLSAGNINKKTIQTQQFLEKYASIIDVNVIGKLAKVLDLNDMQKSMLEKNYFDFTLSNKEGKAPSKLKL